MHVDEHKHAHTYTQCVHKGNKVSQWIHDRLYNPLAKQHSTTTHTQKSRHFPSLLLHLLLRLLLLQFIGVRTSEEENEQAKGWVSARVRPFLFSCCVCAFFSRYLLHTHVLHQTCKRMSSFKRE